MSDWGGNSNTSYVAWAFSHASDSEDEVWRERHRQRKRDEEKRSHFGIIRPMFGPTYPTYPEDAPRAVLPREVVQNLLTDPCNHIGRASISDEISPRWSVRKTWQSAYFQLPLPCITGWNQKPRSPDPTTTVGYDKSSNEAEQRWKEDGWATGLIMYEERNMAHEVDGPGMRVISPTECERLLGFEPGWTHPGGKASSGLVYQRRNADGNAFAVPVITRLIMAVAM